MLDKLSKLLDVPEEEIEKQITSATLMMATAGLILAGKKIKEYVEKKELKNELALLAATAEMFLDKVEKKKNMENGKATQAKIYVVKSPPPPPPKQEGERDDRGSKQD